MRFQLEFCNIFDSQTMPDKKQGNLRLDFLFRITVIFQCSLQSPIMTEDLKKYLLHRGLTTLRNHCRDNIFKFFGFFFFKQQLSSYSKCASSQVEYLFFYFFQWRRSSSGCSSSMTRLEVAFKRTFSFSDFREKLSHKIFALVEYNIFFITNSVHNF